MGLRRHRRAAPGDGQLAQGGESSTPISAITPRQPTLVRGQVLGIRIRPSDTLPTFVVRLGDDTGSVTIVWTGRRTIGGVGLGRRLEIEGTAVATPDGLCIFNPVYRLLG